MRRGYLEFRSPGDTAARKEVALIASMQSELRKGAESLSSILSLSERRIPQPRDQVRARPHRRLAIGEMASSSIELAILVDLQMQSFIC